MKSIISLMLVFLLSINFVLALGVSSPFWDDHALEMYPGETREVAFPLVNRADAETAQAFVSLENGMEIAEITSGGEYTVVPGTSNTKIMMRISVPAEANIGDSYDVGFSVKSNPEGDGTVQLKVKYNVDFPVVVVEKPADVSEAKLSVGMIIGIILAIIGVGIAVFLILNKSKK